MKKRIFPIVLAFVLSLTLMPTSVFASTHSMEYTRGRAQTRGGITATLSASKESDLKAGDKITVTVSFAGKAESDGTFGVGFDSHGLTFVSPTDFSFDVTKGQTSFKNKTYNFTVSEQLTWGVGLAPSCYFSPTLPSNAATIEQPSTSTEKITVKTPYFPGLEITITNPHYYAGEINGGNIQQVKYYFKKETAISFSQDVKLSNATASSEMSIKAGEFFKPSDHSAIVLGINIAAKKDGSYRLLSGNSHTLNSGETLYWLNFVDVMHYEANIKEGYKMTDIRKWTADTKSNDKEADSMSDTSNIASTKDTKSYKINADYDSDKHTDFTYVITGVKEIEQLKFAASPGFNGSAPLAGKTVNVYTVSADSKIKVDGANGFTVNSLQYKNNELTCNQQADNWTSDDWQRIITSAIDFENQKIGSNGAAYGIAKKGSYVSLNKEGYYVFAVRAFVPQVMDTDPNSKTFGQVNYDNAYKYNAVVIHVV